MTIIGIMFLLFFRTLRVPGAVILSIVLTTLCGINYTSGDNYPGDSYKPFGAVTDLLGWKYQNDQKSFWLPDMDDIPSGKKAEAVQPSSVGSVFTPWCFFLPSCAQQAS